MDTCDSDDRQVNVTYHLNRLQRIDSDVDYLVTLNADGRVDPYDGAGGDDLRPPHVHAGLGGRPERGGLD